MDKESLQHIINVYGSSFSDHSFAIDAPILINPITLKGIEYKKELISLVSLKSFDYLETKIADNILKNTSNLFMLPHGEYVKNQDKYLQATQLRQGNCDNPALLGQFGLFAKQDIAEHQIIGFYGGIYGATWAELQHVLNNYDPVLVKRYGNACNKNGIPVICGHFNGNYMSTINDWRPFLWFEQTKEALEEIKTEKYNTNSIIIRSGAYYFIAYLATRDIKKGEQIFTDYGDSYWQYEQELIDQMPQKF